jgi:hypothetical protein
MTGRDAGAAHLDALFGRSPFQDFPVQLAEFLRGQEVPAEVQVVFIGVVDGTGDMAGHRVYGLSLPVEPFGAAGIHQPA